MFRKCLAALLLLPASFVVHGSARAWLKALRLGTYSFFSHVLRNAPACVRRQNSLPYELLVYYPMKAGVEIIRGGGVKSVLRKIPLVMKGRLAGRATETAPPPAPDAWRNTDPPFIPPDHVREMIGNPAIRVVSFDIFDTLLLRPAIRPRDIFHLLARKVDAVHGVDFIGMRWDAEARLGKDNSNIREIYGYMARRHRLDDATAAALMAEELRCEETLLYPRPDVRMLYDEAVRLGKRVIAISDMYLPGDILGPILKRKGYDLAAVYVSCDYGARKSDGSLYESVLAAEDARPSEILHVGDNYQSDYVEAVRRNITAVWNPSVFDRSFHNESVCERLFGEALRRDPIWSIFLGLSLNRLCGDESRTPDNIASPKSLRRFAEVTLAPLVTAFCLFLVSDRDIQASYRKIHFASRDGWLPHKVYSIVREHLGGIEGVYFYAGRRAYYPFLYDSFFTFAQTLFRADNLDAYTLRDLLGACFADTALLSLMEANISEADKRLPFFRHKDRCLRILRRFDREIADCMREKRARARAYYEKVFDPAEKRHVVFDLGYSGSIGKAMTAVTGRPTDKIYFWEEPPNRELDRASGSLTRLFMKGQIRPPYHLLLEELFSPCEGGVIGYDESGRPVLESMPVTESHEKDLAGAHAACLEYATEFCALLGEYAPYASLREPDAVADICRALWDTPFCNLRLLKNIAFPDPLYRTRADSLEKKLENGMPAATVFSGTGFENPENVHTRAPRLHGARRDIGMHLHLYHRSMAHEIVRYLQDFPAPFDLYITIVDASFAHTARNLFSRAFLPNLEKLLVLNVPNRGRDVAPWVLGMRPYQAAYDLFCHIHTKNSAHFDFRDEWRRYLFDNLIRPDSAAEIINAFAEHPDIGCIFPSIYAKLRQVMTSVGDPLHGSGHEHDLICEMLRRMGLGGEFCRSDLFFSGGTMLWYRPHALRQLFTCELRLDEFAAEPVGVGGTLAHAMERMPAIIAGRNGYTTKSLTLYP